MALLNFCINIGFLFAFLLAPAMLVLATWYRKTFHHHVLLMWRTPESVFITIAYFIQSLIFIIVGIAFLFNYIGERTNSHLSPEKNAAIALLCFTLFLGSSIIFLAARTLLVQVVSHKGIIVNHSFFRIPNIHRLISWGDIADYYIKNDYPNAIFNVIYKKEDETFEKIQLYVPSHLQNHIKELLDSKLDGIEGVPAYFWGKKKGIID